MTQYDEMLMDAKGVAAALSRHPNYIYDMRTAGFLMPGGRGTVRSAMQWLLDHPDFRRRTAAEIRFARRARQRPRKIIRTK